MCGDGLGTMISAFVFLFFPFSFSLSFWLWPIEILGLFLTGVVSFPALSLGNFLLFVRPMLLWSYNKAQALRRRNSCCCARAHHKAIHKWWGRRHKRNPTKTQMLFLQATNTSTPGSVYSCSTSSSWMQGSRQLRRDNSSMLTHTCWMITWYAFTTTSSYSIKF